MSSSEEDELTEDESETTLRELVGQERSPVEESFYESFIIQSRTAVDNLYASNVLSCQKHMKVMGDLARQRKVKLSYMEREQKKLLKRMESLKVKQDVHLLKRTKTTSNDLQRSKSAKAEQAKSADKFKSTDRRRPSLPPLNTMLTGDQTSEVVKSPDSLIVPGIVLSKSCNDITLLYNKDSLSQETTLILPSIKPSRSHENLSGSPFITHVPPKHHPTNRGMTSQEHANYIKFAMSHDAKSDWNERKIKTEISTKVKWVPRN